MSSGNHSGTEQILYDITADNIVYPIRPKEGCAAAMMKQKAKVCPHRGDTIVNFRWMHMSQR